MMRSAISLALMQGTMIEQLRVPNVGLGLDWRAGAIVATDVGNGDKVGTMFCDQLVRYRPWSTARTSP